MLPPQRGGSMSPTLSPPPRAETPPPLIDRRGSVPVNPHPWIQVPSFPGLHGLAASDMGWVLRHRTLPKTRTHIPQ
jgi:hypothetical protein